MSKYSIVVCSIFTFLALANVPARPPRVDVLATFDAPGALGFSSAQGINARGDIAVTGGNTAYIRYRNGIFSTGIFTSKGTNTYAGDINSAVVVAGVYTNSTATEHGYLYHGGHFSYFDVPGSIDTVILGLNDNGDFAGAYQTMPGVYHPQAFTYIGGTLAFPSIPDAFNSIVEAIASTGDVAGYYTDMPNDVTHHGFILTADGTLTAPIDYPRTNRLGGTLFKGMNAQGWVGGAYYDPNQNKHGLIFRAPGTFLTFSYPDATQTIINAINDRGMLCGDYLEVDGTQHCFLGQLH